MKSGGTAGVLRDQRGLSLYEITLVISIILVLTTLALLMIVGLRARAEDVALADERVTINLAATSFYTASNFTVFPVREPFDTGPRIRAIDFDAPLPHDSSKTFVPHFLKEVPPSSRLVQWRIDTVTGAVSIGDQGA